MNLLTEGLREAWRLVTSLDEAVMGAAVRTLWISLTAVALATVIGIPVGTWMARTPFRGRRAVVLAARAGMALPTVFIGIVCFGFFSRRGPLGPLELLYTPWPIVIGELMLALPIVISISHGAVSALDPRVGETARTLGANALQRGRALLSEARTGVTLAVLTAFARCVTELGIAMMVGGNIKGRTRTLATATALETGRGEFARGLAMGFILLCIALGVMFLMGILTREDSET